MNNYTRKETNEYGNVFYYNDKNELHRTDGPAIEGADGNKFWYVNGELHRTDGPAIEWANSDKGWWANGDKGWCVNGKYLTEEEFNKHPLVIEHRVGKIIGEVLDENS